MFTWVLLIEIWSISNNNSIVTYFLTDDTVNSFLLLSNITLVLQNIMCVLFINHTWTVKKAQTFWTLLFISMKDKIKNNHKLLKINSKCSNLARLHLWIFRKFDRKRPKLLKLKIQNNKSGEISVTFKNKLLLTLILKN